MHYEVIDIRQEIEAYDRKYRPWPRSGSVSKPYGSSDRDPWYWWMCRWPEADCKRAIEEHEAEQFYKNHRWGLVDDESYKIKLRLSNLDPRSAKSSLWLSGRG